MSPGPFVYRARPGRVVDGDTLDVVVDLGFHLTATLRLRLLGVNTPELHDDNTEVRAAAVKARTFVESWVSKLDPGAAWPILVRTEKSDVFGRWLAEVWADGAEVTLNAGLLDAGLAVVFHRKS